MILKALKEKRFLTSEGLNVRAESTDSGEKYIEGYAALFDHDSKLIAEWHGGEPVQFIERIEQGAFDDVLQSAQLNVLHTVDHDRSKMLGRTVSGTLQLTVDDKGLKYRVKLPNTQLGNDTYELIKRGDYYESSFVFTVDQQNERWYKEGDVVKRTIKKVSGLYDTSTVTDGAYSNTAVSIARNLADLVEPAPVAVPPAVEEKKSEAVNELDLIELQLVLLEN